MPTIKEHNNRRALNSKDRNAPIRAVEKQIITAEHHAFIRSRMTIRPHRFLGKMDGPSRNLDKANFSPKKKEKHCATFWLFKYILWPQWFAYELSLLQVYARRHLFLLSIYRSVLILFSVNYR